jgi:hypothetical protein
MTDAEALEVTRLVRGVLADFNLEVDRKMAAHSTPNLSGLEPVIDALKDLMKRSFMAYAEQTSARLKELESRVDKLAPRGRG